MFLLRSNLPKKNSKQPFPSMSHSHKWDANGIYEMERLNQASPVARWVSMCQNVAMLNKCTSHVSMTTPFQVYHGTFVMCPASRITPNIKSTLKHLP